MVCCYLVRSWPFSRAAGFARHVHANAIGQRFHRLGKIDILVIHDKAKRVAASATAEAIVELLIAINREGGSILVMERAACRVVFAGFLELHPPIHHLNDIDPVQKVVEELLWYASCHG